MLVLACVIIGGTLWGTVWWDERPLAEIERLILKKESWSALSQVDRFLRNRIT